LRKNKATSQATFETLPDGSLLTRGEMPETDTYTIKVRTRYQRYIGAFVLHCHILDHEDQGMMQNVAVVLPNGSITKAVTGPVAAPMAMPMDHPGE